MFISMKLKLFSIMPLLLAVTACGGKSMPSPDSSPTSTETTVAASATPSLSVTQDARNPESVDPDVKDYDCGMKIHIGNFAPVDKGGPIGDYTAVLNDGTKLTGTVQMDGDDYIFIDGNLGKLNSTLNSDPSGTYVLNEGGLKLPCKTR